MIPPTLHLQCRKCNRYLPSSELAPGDRLGSGEFVCRDCDAIEFGVTNSAESDMPTTREGVLAAIAQAMALMHPPELTPNDHAIGAVVAGLADDELLVIRDSKILVPRVEQAIERCRDAAVALEQVKRWRLLEQVLRIAEELEATINETQLETLDRDALLRHVRRLRTIERDVPNGTDGTEREDPRRDSREPSGANGG